MIPPAARLLPLAAALLAGCGSGDSDANLDREVHIVGNTEDTVIPTAAPNAAVSEEAAPNLSVQLAANGLSLIGGSPSPRSIAFGTARAEVVRSIATITGDPIEQGDNQECGAGALSFATFRDGLALYFQEGRFAGWDLEQSEGKPLATVAGIGIGSTRQQFDSTGPVRVEDTTIGTEFTAGGISGLLSSRDPTAQVSNLWAGVTCIAR